LRLVFDPSLSGVSGDMMLGALISLGADSRRIADSLEALASHIPKCHSIKLKVRETLSLGIRATRAEVLIEEDVQSRLGGELRRSLDSYLEASNLHEKAISFAVKVLNLILEAESRVHGQPASDVRLKELGLADTLAEIVGVAEALHQFNAFDEVYSLPIAVGGGHVKTAHGLLPVPTFATLEILRIKGFPFKFGPVDGELATPTGVALLTALATPLPNLNLTFKPLKIGYGAGALELPGQPNILRVWSEMVEPVFLKDKVVVLETGLDDVTGESLGYVAERLMGEGALDVAIIPCLGKKGRPAHILRVLSTPEKLNSLVKTMFNETRTLGIRIQQLERVKLQREDKLVEVDVAGKSFQVKVKVFRSLDGEIQGFKPEFEDLKKLAAETGIPLKKAIELVMQKFSQKPV
jgi:hypothetical protein